MSAYCGIPSPAARNCGPFTTASYASLEKEAMGSLFLSKSACSQGNMCMFTSAKTGCKMCPIEFKNSQSN